jgi:hypothetical protein
MTLKEQLQKLKVNVKIGANSGFLFCGTYDEDTIDTLNAISIREKEKIKREIKQKSSYLKDFETIWDKELRVRYENLEKAKKMDDKNAKVTKVEIEEIREAWVKDKETNYNLTKKRYDLISEYIKTFQFLPDREVKEIYDTIDVSEPKGTKIIIVDGIEKGAYWLTTEYMKDNA